MADTYENYTPARHPVGEPGVERRPARSVGCHGGSAVERFVLVSGICVAIWLMTGAGYFWPMWVMLGTGIPALLTLRRRW